MQLIAAAEPVDCPLPFVFQPKVSAGPATAFSPAEDWLEGVLDISKKLITNPAASYWFEVEGDCMNGARLFGGDWLLVDSSITPSNRAIVIAKIDSKWVVKRFRKGGSRVWLEPDPVEEAAIIEFNEGVELEIFGVVTSVIRKFG